MSESVQFKIKLPSDVKEWIALQAARNLRSQSNEIILAVREKMEREAANTTN
ncbi:Arc family DNA-binding protein [Shimia gijangensis]|uniref:Arc family DNA-binding protein n=1 Tax=Shimia gijangensis TaxID=1470563 RepID=UPI0009FA88D6|nr:Arc family DNA-binding protein [Shimia gijangensis]